MKQENHKKEIESPLADLDGLQNELHNGIEVVGAIQELLDGAGANNPQSYADALFSAYCYLQATSNEMRKVIDGAFAARKAASA